MEETYYLANDELDGVRLVHTEGCEVRPEDCEELGDFDNCMDAMDAAFEIDEDADGCPLCCPDCNTGGQVIDADDYGEDDDED